MSEKVSRKETEIKYIKDLSNSQIVDVNWILIM